MKLLIVDDGHYIVEYLKHLLDWKKFGVQQVVTSTNSLEARHLLSQNDVDILITDIRMPEVSGLDLLEHISGQLLKTKVVFLSGYSQFDYAQKAIRLGALDYLLKPVDKEDMEKAMQQVLKNIDEQQRKQQPVQAEFDGLGFLLSVIGGAAPAKGDNEFAACDAVQQLKERYCFFQLTDAKGSEEVTLRNHDCASEGFIWTAGPSVTGLLRVSGAGPLAAEIENISFSESFEFADKNTVRHIFCRFYYREEPDAGDCTLLQNCTAHPKRENVDWEAARKNILRSYAKLQTRKQQILYLLDFIQLLYFTSGRLQQSEVAGWIFKELAEPDDALESVLLCVTRLERSPKLTNSHIVRTIQAYITGHIGDGLSLDDLGKIVHLHPVYLSKVYKQETGENLSGFIAAKRLEKASQLLRESNLHVIDISQLVGYKKPQYFIKLFKEQYGITPYQYRRQQIQ
ncbi:response regulator [Paenibacillus sp. FSL R7-0345]|uniref:response regulator transcription factor n=1 Tax=Paenibacillus sp. FSL R7-0345 TaxID=2954535 RepID=UPI003159C78B